jgi:hypothetical protein
MSLYSPINDAMYPKERIDEDGERERFCAKCQEWWPADREFFYTSRNKKWPWQNGKPKLHSWCKACYTEWRNARRQAQRVPDDIGRRNRMRTSVDI